MSRILRPRWDVVWMGLAQLLAQRSTCDRLQVGCVLVSWDHTRVAGVGYNGGPMGGFNDCISNEPGKCGHLHAEINALIKADYSGGPYRAYVTTQPCFPCAVALINGNVKEVVYREPYRIVDGLVELRKAKIEVRQFRMVEVTAMLPPDKIDARTFDSPPGCGVCGRPKAEHPGPDQWKSGEAGDHIYVDPADVKATSTPPTCVTCHQDYGTYQGVDGPQCRSCWREA